MKGTKSVREFEDEDERKRINVIRNERKKIENTTNFGTVALVLCSALLCSGVVVVITIIYSITSFSWSSIYIDTDMLSQHHHMVSVCDN